MRSTTVPLDEKDIDHVKLLHDCLGTEEFSRMFPGVEIFDTEVSVRHEHEHDWQKTLTTLMDTPIPARSMIVALDDLRRTITRLENEKRQLDDRLARANARTTLITATVSTLVALLSIVVTLLSTRG